MDGQGRQRHSQRSRIGEDASSAYQDKGVGSALCAREEIDVPQAKLQTAKKNASQQEQRFVARKLAAEAEARPKLRVLV